MRIRLHGTDPEIRTAIERLRQVFVVAAVTHPQALRWGQQSRVEVEVYHPAGIHQQSIAGVRS